MKRSFKITAHDEDIKVEVTIKIRAESGRLTRNEMDRMKKKAADKFMETLQTLPYFWPYLSNMKVK